MAKPLFHAGEKRLFVAGLHIDDAAGRKTYLSQRRREEIGPCHAPEHLALRAGGDTSRKQGSCSAVDCTVAAAGDLMQRTECKPTTWQAPIDLGNTKRQDLPPTAACAFEALDALAKF